MAAHGLRARRVGTCRSSSRRTRAAMPRAAPSRRPARCPQGCGGGSPSGAQPTGSSTFNSWHRRLCGVVARGPQVAVGGGPQRRPVLMGARAAAVTALKVAARSSSGRGDEPPQRPHFDVVATRPTCRVRATPARLLGAARSARRRRPSLRPPGTSHTQVPALL